MSKNSSNYRKESNELATTFLTLREERNVSLMLTCLLKKFYW